MTTATGNLFESIPETIGEEIFSELARGKHMKIERILSKGQSSPDSGWHDQENSGWVAVLQGAATITFEDGADVHLHTGSYLNIPAHTKHKVACTASETETVWLAVHYQ